MFGREVQKRWQCGKGADLARCKQLRYIEHAYSAFRGVGIDVCHDRIGRAQINPDQEPATLLHAASEDQFSAGTLLADIELQFPTVHPIACDTPDFKRADFRDACFKLYR